MTDINEQYTNEIHGNYIFPTTLNIQDINENNYIIKEIEGDVYYSLVTGSGQNIYTLLDNSNINVLQDKITGTNGDILNVCIISAIKFPNANLDNDYNNAIGYDFKYAINNTSVGNVIDIKPTNINNELVIFFTVVFKTEPSDEQKANSFNSILINNGLIVSMFNQSNLIKNLSNFTAVELYATYETVILKKNVNFDLINVNALYNAGNLTITNNTIGLYDKWSYKINENQPVIINNSNIANVTITLTTVYKLHIKFYNKSYEIINKKLLLIDPTTNLEANTHSIYDITNTYVISVINNLLHINNVQQDTITLKRGVRYIFDQNNTTNNQFPLSIYTTNANIDENSLYLNGVNYFLNDIKKLKNIYKYNISEYIYRYVEFTVPINAPNTLYYNGLLHNNIGGIINIIN
tara:strand:- start:11832 stop:13055 length:1224 start_codon:yes stop_codon:yes gene_type:complete